MKIRPTTIKSSPHIGIFSVTNDNFTFVPKNTPEKEKKDIKEILDTDIYEFSVGGSSLLGVFLVLGKNKALLPSLVEKDERMFLEDLGFECLVLENRINAYGNLLVLGKNKALISPLFDEKSKEEIEEFFSIKTKVFSFRETQITGALVFFNENGFIASPLLKEEEVQNIRNFLDIPGKITTINFGDVFIGNSIIGNKKGVLVGSRTTGYELLVVQEALIG